MYASADRVYVAWAFDVHFTRVLPLFEEVVAKSKIIVRLSSSCCDAAELAIVKRNVKCLKQRIL